MQDNISRRSFFRKSAGIGAATVSSAAILNTMCGDKKNTAQTDFADIAVATGADYRANTVKAVEILGGMGRFVPQNAKVAILPNAQHNNPGTFTKPAIITAVIKMCLDAGAKEVNCLSWLPRRQWDNAGLSKVIADAGGNLINVDMEDKSLYRTLPIPNGICLTEANIMEELFNNDIFINMPITKDHAGNKFTGTMKNLMGLNFPKTNRKFHTGNFKNDDIQHLDQCIADLNTVVKPDLCIVDATEFIITNGPFGPGKLHKPQKVVAGTDRVAVDAFCATLWGLNASDIIMINRAHKHNLGEIDISKKKIIEVEV